MLVPDLGAFLRTEALKLVERDLSPETMGLLSSFGPDEEPYPQLVEHLSIYLDAHWGDLSQPPPEGPGPAFGMAALVERLAALPPVARAVELGCSVGRGVRELARGAGLTVGVDLHFGVLRRARRILSGQPLRYARRQAGRHCLPATVHAPPVGTTALICGDALDPPLCPGAFDRVVALNLLDSVAWPRQMLSVLDGLCARGGEVILGSPYSWRSGVVAEQGRLGEEEPAASVRAALLAGQELEVQYQIEEEAELPWSLRRDRRSAHAYLVHYLRARKPAV